MPSVDLALLAEINALWDPVRPYLAKQIGELYKRRDGVILEMGPFSGLIVSLQQEGIGNSFFIAAFPGGMGPFLKREIRKEERPGEINLVEMSPSLTGMKSACVDLVVFRGAFFFPSMYGVDFGAINRVLRPGGFAFIGGGYGKYTPEPVIEEIGRRSRELNLQLGKVAIPVEKLQEDIERSNASGRFGIVTEGGLWVVMEKQ